jgi:sugar phosphate isomerase/epimerase
VFDIEIIRIAEGFDPLRYEPLLQAGARLGARAVLIAGDDAEPARLADGYARICALAWQFGMTADLEFMPWTAVPDARAALRTVLAAGSPQGAGILVDALHFGRSSTTLDDIRAIPRELLHYAQICDAPSGVPHSTRQFSTDELIHTARSERLLPGEGDIALAPLFAALPADLPVSVEIPHQVRLPRLGAREWARQALEASRQVLEPAFRRAKSPENPLA